MPATRRSGRTKTPGSAGSSRANSRANSRASTPSTRRGRAGRGGNGTGDENGSGSGSGSGAADGDGDEAEPTLDPSADFVDLTGNTSEEGDAEEHPSSDVVFLAERPADAVKKGKVEGKGLSNTAPASAAPALPPASSSAPTSATASTSAAPAAEAPSSAPPAGERPKSKFTPFRPMLLGVKIAEDEDDEEGQIDEVLNTSVDSKGAAQPAEPAGAPPPPPPAAPKLDDDAEAENADGNTSVLLLPDNVHVAGEDSEDDDADVSVLQGVHMLDDNNTRGVARYWADTESDLAHFLAEADQSKVCRNCKKPGHQQKDCPHTICTTCGAEDDHTRNECPWSLICFGCGQRGHRKMDCPDPASRRLKKIGCDRCGVWDHTQNSCPSLWRVYVYRKNEDRNRVLEEKEAAEGWKKQAVGGDPDERWCYNCGQEGHFGDDCPIERGSLARAAVNSAFSERTAGRGPYALSRRPGKHTRWDDDLPYEQSSKFAGANAGAKSRERERERQRARDRDRDRDSDRDDWFNSNSSTSTPVTGMGRQGWGSERRYDRNRNDSSPRRPWDSERRRSPSPDRRRQSHPLPQRPNQGQGRGRHSGGGGITFGKISGSSLGARLSSPGAGPDSPSVRGGRGQGGGQSLLQRALGQSQSQSQSGSSSRQQQGGRGSNRHHPYARNDRDKRNGGGGGGGGSSGSRGSRGGGRSDKGRDWEADWRASGAGGGNVSRWGEEMDREVRDNRTKAGPVRGPGGGGGGARGQRYTGGY